MSDKFQNKYRIASTRLQNWDYRWSAPYFVTICIADRQHFFGEIVDGKMNLSHQGILADILWYEIKNHSKNVVLGAFVVMPNHIHGIVILNNVDIPNEDNGTIVTDVGTGGGDETGHVAGTGQMVVVETGQTVVETGHALSLRRPQQQPKNPQPEKTIGQQRFQNQGKNSLSSIIGSYKSAVTKHANRLELPFAWQSRFHDHIIRNDAEYQRIENYIVNNPKKWKDDKFNGQ